VDRIVATSSDYVRSSDVLQRYSEKTSVIPIGLPERVMPGDQVVDAWQQRIGRDFFLFVGELRYYKGIDFLLGAARTTGLPVVIVGKGEVPEDVPPNVTMLGSVSDADREALLSLCRGFVFPSHLRSEAFGVALLEAARAGRAMISCDIGTGTSFVNEDGETGLIVPPASIEALAGAMLKLSSDSELAARMGRAARDRYQALFSVEQMATAYEHLYDQLVRTHPGADFSAAQTSLRRVT
jgi:glycosyltransferase involved in cell wall biosynthesis